MNPAPRWAPTVLTRAPLMNTINPPIISSSLHHSGSPSALGPLLASQPRQAIHLGRIHCNITSLGSNCSRYLGVVAILGVFMVVSS
ncbi:hypothetical protein B0H14DRAFT_3501109 [Mycena olivaceomarginata]|nr:hypothetical protein B0H14DRAFT_3501109 [Mycena olivaceomarginata]